MKLSVEDNVKIIQVRRATRQIHKLRSQKITFKNGNREREREGVYARDYVCVRAIVFLCVGGGGIYLQ